METLTARDAKHVLDFVAGAESVGADEPFGREVLSRLVDLVPAAWVGYGERDLIRRRCLLSHEYPTFDEVYGSFDFEAAAAVENPLCSYQYDGHFEAVTLSELLPRRALRRTPYYSLVLEPLGITDRLGVAIPSPATHAKRFFLDRTGGEFSSRDRLVLDVLQPHFARLWRAAQTQRRLRAAMVALERGGEEDTRGVIFFTAGGRVDAASPAARRLLNRYFEGGGAASLPPVLADWLEADAAALRVRDGTHHLRIDRCGDTLLLEEIRDELGLTRREREILAWVARGKTNREIAEVLRIAPSTVRKHLDNVYAKLGVRSRTAAVTAFLGYLDTGSRDEDGSAQT